MRRPRKPPVLPFLVPGFLLTLLAGTLCIWPPSLAVFLEGKVYDSFLRSAPPRPVTGSVVVVDLDEATLERLGQWPWPRYRVARLLGKIAEGGAAAVGLDMVFAEPDRTSLRFLSREVRRDLGSAISLSGVSPEALDTDGVLAETLAGGPFVLGYQFDFDE
ncbi:MAG: CHASE2 domain-containing protein, partial [Candidatus Deferrimicrobiaceae bacterium]